MTVRYPCSMHPGSEQHSRLAAPLLGTTLLLCLGAVARAQAPTCAWGDGVVLPGTESRNLMLAGDGGAGVLVVSSPVNWFDVVSPPQIGTLRLHHILEQGRLDPAMPAAGVTFYTPPDPLDYQGTELERVLADGSGGVYALTRACNPNLPHTRCWERSALRLLHVTGTGNTSPGWPLAGLLIPALGKPSALDSGDIVLDGAGGVIVAWIHFDPDSFLTPSVRAQRFSAAGSALWPGEQGGRELLAPAQDRNALRVAGDGLGGAAVVVSGLTAQGRYELFASRVLADGSLPWGTAGKPVLLQPSYSSYVQGLAMDANGLVFVSAGLLPLTSGSPMVTTQLLSRTGSRSWGALGIMLGDLGSWPASAACPGDGYLTTHRDGSGTLRFQKQDVFGSPGWGAGPDGIVASWVGLTQPIGPLLPPDGHLLSVWTDPGPLYLGPPTVAHAMELDAAGEIVPGWTDTGVVVCGGLYGLALTDAIASAGQLFVAFGGCEFPGPTPRVQRLSRAVLAVPPSLPGRALELASPSPNPARGAWNVRFALREAAKVTFEAFDIAGRRVLERDLGEFAPGPHVVNANGGEVLAPGVYRIRVRAGGNAAERVLVRLR